MAVTQGTEVGRRRAYYGTNVVLQIVMVTLVVVGAVYLAQGALRGQLDLTRRGVNSLTPRTLQLLGHLKQDVKIVAIYTVLSKYDERAQKRQTTVQDLLDLYEANGHGHITADVIDPMKDRGRMVAVLNRLRDKPAYKDEAAAHIQALTDFSDLSQQISDLVAQQIAEVDRLSSANPELRDTFFLDINQELQRIQRQGERTAEELRTLQAGDMPAYGRAIETVRNYLQAVSTYFEAFGNWVAKNASLVSGLGEAGEDFVNQARMRYDEMREQIGTLLTQTAELERTKLEDLADQLNRWANAPPILVEADDEALVLPFAEVWPFRMNANVPLPADGDEREFAGEQAVSSAILRLTQKERTAVVFTRYGGESPIVPDFSRMQSMRRIPRAPFGELNELLEQENFITHDWDVKTDKAVPKIEDASRRVYVVFPPTPPVQTDPRRPPAEGPIAPEDVQLIIDAVKESGRAIFLASWSPPPQGPMPVGGRYEFGDYLKNNWGVEVKHKYIVLPFAPSMDDPELFLATQLTQGMIIGGEDLRFTDHPISAPLRALPAGFRMACPLQIVPAEEFPEGVDVEPIVLVRETDSVWAIEDVMRLNADFQRRQGTYPRDDDIRPPFPVAVSAEREEDGRLVVFASEQFAADSVLGMQGLMQVGNSLALYARFPANADLFMNAIHWLTDNSNRISVGVRGTDVPRLSRLEEGPALEFWRVFLMAIWPALALVVGGGVWLFRRR